MQNYVDIDKNIRCKLSDLGVETPLIRLSKVFDYEMVEHFSEEFNKALSLCPKVIPIVIDSYGGEVYCLLELISLFQSSPIPIATICNGKAMSCGAMLFMFGSEGLRFMSEHATLMIHEVSAFSFGKVEEIKTDAHETERLNNLIFKLAAKNLGKKEDYFMELLHKHNHADIFMTAKEAKKHNICNHIGVPQLITKVQVTQNFTLNGKEITVPK
jgi:ATP-dependent protease ClpP protease subunit